MLDTYDVARQAWNEALPMAVSHRDCFVVAGASLFGSSSKMYRVFGYNLKPEPGDTANIHAEELILYQAETLDATTLSLVVVGVPQPDNSITDHDLVLSPCSYRCTPKIIADASVGQFTMTVGVNPRTGATQFIPHSRLITREWQDIPCIEVDSLNNRAEWLEKALPIIDMLMQQLDIAELESFVEEKRRLQVANIARQLAQINHSGTSGYEFLGSPSAFAPTDESSYTPTAVPQRSSYPLILMGLAHRLDKAVDIPGF